MSRPNARPRGARCWTPLLAAGLVLALLAPAPAAAQLTEKQGFPVERMRLSLDRLGIIDVEWGDVLPHLGWEVGLWFTGERNPLVAYRASDGARLGSLVGTRLGGSLIAAVGLWNRLEVALELPLVFYQDRSGSFSGVSSGPLPSLSAGGAGDLRIAPKVRILKRARHGLDLSLILSLTVPSGGDAAYRGESTVSFIPELAASRAFGPVRLAANVGYLLRKDVTYANLTVGDELFGRLGVAYRFEDRQGGGPPVELGVSLSSAFSATAPFDHTNTTAAEILGQASYTFHRELVALVGGGGGLHQGYGTPDWRVFAGLRYTHAPRSAPVLPPPRCPPLPAGFPTVPGPTPDDCPLLDTDGDGIPDVNDKCPKQPGPAVNSGCPDQDRDGDGIIDRLDKCPDEPEDQDGFQDEDGCPDPDNDQDGVLDKDDKCPNVPGPKENDGCPDPDRDGDGVPDRIDNCPDEPGPPENHGCKVKQQVVITDSSIEILDRVYFKTNKAVIEKRSYPLLDNVAAVIVAHTEVGRVRVEGHTDNRGRPRWNTTLSQSRAESVVDYLVRKGVPRARLEAKGFGPSAPIADNGTEEGRAKNRRVEFKLVGAKGTVQSRDSEVQHDTIGH